MINYDNLKIGDLITENWLDKNAIESEAIGRAYDLKLRSDLTSESPNVRNTGELDISNVYEVIKTYGQATQELLLDAKDVSNAIATIDVEHWFIHKGLHFFDGRVLEIPAKTTWSWVVITGDKAPHMTYEVSPTNGGVAIATYENITANEDGTLITPLNNNRLSSMASTTSFRLNPTGISTVGATLIRSARIGTVGGTAQRAGGNLARTNEVVFKHNTKYLLTIQNLNNDVCYVNLTHNWYENGL